MKKENISILVYVTILITLLALIGYIFVNNQILDDAEKSVTIYRWSDYTVRQNLEDGKQYDYISIDSFNIADGSLNEDSYGFLRVNETTGRMEFIKWRHSSNITVTLIDGPVNVNSSNMWVHFYFANPIPLAANETYSLEDLMGVWKYILHLDSIKILNEIAELEDKFK